MVQTSYTKSRALWLVFNLCPNVLSFSFPLEAIDYVVLRPWIVCERETL